MIGMFGVAYMVTCHASGKKYIGVTRQELKIRWRDHQRHNHCAALYSAIKKYGIGAFTIDPIASAATEADLLATEKALIIQEQTMPPMGYNLCVGGRGILNPSDETRAKLLGRKVSEETRAKLRKASKDRVPPNHLGVKRSSETVEKIRKMRLGKIHSAETRERIRQAKLGSKASDETRAKLRAAQVNTRPPSALGLKRSPETIERMSKSQMGKKHTAEAKARMRTSALARVKRSRQLAAAIPITVA